MNLASALSKGEVKDLNSVKEYVGDKIKWHIGATNTDDRTPLMIACMNGQIAIAEWLLESGANVNFCARDGNTALHMTCRGNDEIIRQCRKSTEYPLQSMDDRIKILRLLFKHCAAATKNLDGLLPLHVAALHSQTVIVKFLVEENSEMPVEDKLRALEILGFSQSVCDKFHYLDAYETFRNVHSMREDLKADTSETLTGSDFESNTDQCKGPFLSHPTFSDVESEKDEHNISIHGFVVGDRVLPIGLKEKYLFEPLAGVACNAFFYNNPAEGYRIFQFLLSMESQSRLKLGTVVKRLASNTGFLSKAMPLNNVLLQSCELVASYRDVVCKLDKACLLKNGPALFKYLKEFSFNVAYFHGGVELCDSLVESVRGVISFTQHVFKSSEAGDTLTVGIVSVTHGMLYSLGEEFVDNMYSGMSKKPVSYVTYVILKLLPYDNVCCVDEDKNTMLHYVMQIVPLARDIDFAVDMARALVRHGCLLHAVNSEGYTALDILLENCESEDTQRQELISLLDQRANALTLEELAIRTVLQNKIPYWGVLPLKICEILDGVNDLNMSETDSSFETGSASN
ncbi:uncharacterized protein [Diadema antillarum]|uniref:uncharacterized protein n=1 Tax=Diadema antillarum TaxID=105358 RepID=UPI003A8B982D